MTRQGLPAATTPAGISLVTTLPAPMMQPSPMVTPISTVTFAPSHTLSPMVMGSDTTRPLARSSTS